MNVLVIAPFKKVHMERIRDAAGESATVVQMQPRLNTPFDDELLEALRAADIVIGEPDLRLLHKEGVGVKLVQMTWSGTDKYTRTKAGMPDGTMLANAAGAYGPEVSMYVVGQILSIAQNLAGYARQQSTTAWNDLGATKSLDGATVLIYGAGDIGTWVAKRLRGLGVGKIVGVCRRTIDPREGFDQLITLPKAELILPQADVVVGCMPDLSETTNYFGARRLALLKEDSILVNVGRGTFIDLVALEKELGQDRIRGAALDVTNPEPLPHNHPLWRSRRCIVTPHISGRTFGRNDILEARVCDICCENLRRYVSGEELINRVV